MTDKTSFLNIEYFQQFHKIVVKKSESKMS